MNPPCILWHFTTHFLFFMPKKFFPHSWCGNCICPKCCLKKKKKEIRLNAISETIQQCLCMSGFFCPTLCYDMHFVFFYRSSKLRLFNLDVDLETYAVNVGIIVQVVFEMCLIFPFLMPIWSYPLPPNVHVDKDMSVEIVHFWFI